MKIIKTEQGFSLIEVLASIVIITLVLMIFSSVFVQNNKSSIRNTEKLITVQLADAYLERMRLEKKHVDLLPTSPITTTINGKTYTISYINRTQPAETNMKMINLLVVVTAPDNKTKGQVEGYVAYE